MVKKLDAKQVQRDVWEVLRHVASWEPRTRAQDRALNDALDRLGAYSTLVPDDLVEDPALD